MWMIYILLIVIKIATAGKDCKTDNDCEKRWPGATCRNGRCSCPLDSIRRKSESYGWICLSLIDASTGMLGPPITCPLPFGTGYHSILNLNNTPVFCATVRKESCPKGYECIRSIGLSISQADNGVCCPRREIVCQQPACESPDGWLLRWFFDGETCRPFRWNPEVQANANNFLTKTHCHSYCIQYINSLGS
ncbi:unnamed protein product [Thelazia callipaeda]|uniref:BPTI/Kunitz inhibitor domain-containing protein n=1 Tax=Thelazia callipaeda TaxID=103827 RepID=A0A0N5CSC8_THECL|nr:unnamed protein product [Thelazia callipaeda]